MTNKSGKKTKLSKSVIIAAAAVVIIVVAFGAKIIGKTNDSGSDKDQLRAEKVIDGDIHIPAGDITETAKFFPAEINGTKLEVLAVKAPDGSIRTAFNTCQVCYSSGKGYYVQEGDVLVCQNCGNRFSMDQVEIVKGGCNPVPITDEYKTVNDNDKSITIKKDYLSEATVIFQNWK